MTLYGLAGFALVYGLAVASPGPGVAAIVARSLSRGTRGAPAFIAGFLIGDLTWLTVAATGLAALAQTAYAVFVAVKYAGVAYLLYLSYRMWKSAAKPIETNDAAAPAEDTSQRPLRLFLASLALTMGNPKTMVFFLALLPTVVKLETLTVSGFFEIAAVICVVLPAVLGGYAYAAARAGKLLKSPRAIRIVNRGSATAMASAAVVIAAKS
jgi:threonine/homoserine/homoserine lactone efflux protein